MQWLYRAVDRITGSFGYVIALNGILVLWIGLQWMLPHPFDPYPFPMLNLVLAWVVAVMDAIIMVSQNVARKAADKQTVYLLGLLETNLGFSKTLKEMGEAERVRDQELILRIQRIEEKLSAPRDDAGAGC